MKEIGNNLGKRAVLFIIILIGILSFSVLIRALTVQEELSQLESELSSQGYNWLVNFINNDNLMLSIDNKILTLPWKQN